MLEGVRERLWALARRLQRLERRELDAFLRWIERTGNLLHLSVLLFVPLLIAVVTWLANATAAVSFLLFPPLASGTYTLFADPEGTYATPSTFVGGMTVGALCGWLALALATLVGLGGGRVSATGAALGVFFTGVCTWALDLEEPAAFLDSTARAPDRQRAVGVRYRDRHLKCVRRGRVRRLAASLLPTARPLSLWDDER